MKMSPELLIMHYTPNDPVLEGFTQTSATATSVSKPRSLLGEGKLVENEMMMSMFSTNGCPGKQSNLLGNVLCFERLTQCKTAKAIQNG